MKMNRSIATRTAVLCLVSTVTVLVGVQWFRNQSLVHQFQRCIDQSGECQLPIYNLDGFLSETQSRKVLKALFDKKVKLTAWREVTKPTGSTLYVTFPDDSPSRRRRVAFFTIVEYKGRKGVRLSQLSIWTKSVLLRPLVDRRLLYAELDKFYEEIANLGIERVEDFFQNPCSPEEYVTRLMAIDRANADRPKPKHYMDEVK